MTPSGRIHAVLSCLLLASSCSSTGADAPGTDEVPLSAIVTHEERIVRPDGVTQTMRYQERMVRADGRVWIERLVDPRVHRGDDEAHAGRHVHDWGTATRLVTRDASDAGGERAYLQFVLPHEREVVDVKPTEYDSVGFYPVWSESAQIVSDADLAGLAPSERSAPRGSRWLERRDGDRYVRVLWSESLRLALEAEAGSKDGAVLRRLQVEIEPKPSTVPWTEIWDFARKDVNDFRD